MFQFLLLLGQEVGVVRYILSVDGPNWVQLPRLKRNELTLVKPG